MTIYITVCLTLIVLAILIGNETGGKLLITGMLGLALESLYRFFFGG